MFFFFWFNNIHLQVRVTTRLKLSEGDLHRFDTLQCFNHSDSVCCIMTSVALEEICLVWENNTMMMSLGLSCLGHGNNVLLTEILWQRGECGHYYYTTMLSLQTLNDWLLMNLQDPFNIRNKGCNKKDRYRLLECVWCSIIYMVCIPFLPFLSVAS